MNIQMAAEDYARTRDGLKELLDLRNGLVHHFIERYDLWQPEGCVAAREYLMDCYTSLHCLKGQRSAQARNAERAAGVKDRRRSAVTGAAWRGATLESLTAARRDEIMFLNVPAGFC